MKPGPIRNQLVRLHNAVQEIGVELRRNEWCPPSAVKDQPDGTRAGDRVWQPIASESPHLDALLDRSFWTCKFLSNSSAEQHPQRKTRGTSATLKSANVLAQMSHLLDRSRFGLLLSNR